MVDFLEKMIAFGHIASSFSNRVIRIHRNFPREPSRTLKPGMDRAQSSQNPLNRSGASPQRFGQRIPDRPLHPQPPRALSSSFMYLFCFVLNRDLVHLNFSEVHRPPSTLSRTPFTRSAARARAIRPCSRPQRSVYRPWYGIWDRYIPKNPNTLVG